ncbi:hypothetical protein D3C71_1703930 [compost metagenome]
MRFCAIAACSGAWTAARSSAIAGYWSAISARLSWRLTVSGWALVSLPIHRVRSKLAWFKPTFKPACRLAEASLSAVDTALLLLGALRAARSSVVASSAFFSASCFCSSSASFCCSQPAWRSRNALAPCS